MGIIYNIIFIIFSFFYIPVFLIKKKKRHGIGLRFGIYPEDLISKLRERKNIWIHAVSVGETMAVSSLITKLRSRFPGYRLVITTVTETGNSVARKLAAEDDIVLFLPFDVTFIIRKAMRYIRPSLLIIVETELWPNLIREASRNQVATILINGRISEGSFKGYACVRFMIAPVLRGIDLLLMQTDVDRDRIIFLGADESRVKISGNLKFDSISSAGLSEQKKKELNSLLNIKEGEELLVAGSTHAGEEEAVIKAFKNLKDQFDSLRLLIAPRHIERIPDIEKLIENYGCKPVRISKLSTSTICDMRNAKYEIFILDTIGQLKDFYSIAKVVFVGGSLVKKGGQNFIEPALFSKPIVFGPYTFNFRDITEMFLKNEAALMANDGLSLKKALERLLLNPGLCKDMGERAKNIVEANKGATDITLGAIEGMLK
ncbi:MAG: 3-deoxy-D-manno-octulosonic acid transferase [Candidatus Omnitrophota bacterium]